MVALRQEVFWTTRQVLVVLFLFAPGVLQAAVEPDPKSSNHLTSSNNGTGHWRTYTAEDGLAHGNVNALLQDRAGYLWIGTRGGVSRFDGRRFVSFTTTDGLGHDNAKAVIQDRSGDVWVGTDAGVSRFDGESWTTYTTEDGLAHSEVQALMVDRSGAVWVGTDGGVNRIDGELWTTFTTRDGLAAGEVEVFLEDRSGAVWVGTEGGGVSRFDGESWKTYTMADGLAYDKVKGIAQDHNGNLWFATEGGVSRFDGKLWKTYQTTDGLTDDEVEAVLTDREGNLWFGTEGGGVSHFDGELWTTYTTADGLAGDMVEVLLEDREGNLWMGTKGDGLSCFAGQSWTTYTTRDGLGFDKVKSVLQDPAGNMWIATDGGGVSRFDGLTWTTYTTADGLVYDEVESVLIDREGHFWFGTEGRGVSRFDGQNWTSYTTDNGLPHGEVEALFEDVSGAIWFGTDGGGVCRFDGETWKTYSTTDGLAHNEVKEILQDRDENLWFATENGVSRFGRDGWRSYTTRDGLPHERIDAVYLDGQDRLWFGSKGGATRFDGENWRTYTTADGLVNDKVSDITQDDDGHIWFATGGGVSRFDGHNWTSYNVADGLVHDHVGTVYQDREGRFWFGTLGGLSRFVPPPPTSPLVSIDAIVADQRYTASSKPAIPAGEHLIALEFSAISFKTRPEAMRYIYRLKGYEEEWQSSHIPRVEYPQLPAGDYTFEVNAIDRDLVSSQRPATAQLRVRVDYTWIGVWTLLSGALVLIVLQSVRVVRRGHTLQRLHGDLQLANEELELRVEERTAELSSTNEQLQVEIAERKQMEEDLRRYQKMELIGELSAGIAHNFNNVLQGMIGGLEVSILKATPSQQTALTKVVEMAERGASVVRQLMLFGQPVRTSDLRPIDLRMVIENTVGLCHKSFDQRIEVKVEWSEILPAIQGDVGQLEQVLLNLCLNARDALMEAEREAWYVRIAVDTCVVRTEDLPRNMDLAVGVYGRVQVEDNGAGMDEATQERIFEPFFTTKEVDQGSGLGLATVYAIVRDHGGWVECESEVGVGTTVSIYLPTLRQQGVIEPSQPEQTPVQRGTETILVIDDEPMVRQFLCSFLDQCGYGALEAADGLEGLEVLRREEVDLVLLDLSMPRMPGREVLERIQAEFPHVRVIIFTGYATRMEEFAGAHGVLQKPLPPKAVTNKVREVLDGSILTGGS